MMLGNLEFSKIRIMSELINSLDLSAVLGEEVYLEHPATGYSQFTPRIFCSCPEPRNHPATLPQHQQNIVFTLKHHPGIKYDQKAYLKENN